MLTTCGAGGSGLVAAAAVDRHRGRLAQQHGRHVLVLGCVVSELEPPSTPPTGPALWRKETELQHQTRSPGSGPTGSMTQHIPSVTDTQRGVDRCTAADSGSSTGVSV